MTVAAPMPARPATPLVVPWYQARWLRQALVTLFLVGVAVLLVHAGRKVPWAEVGKALQETPAWQLAAALLFSVLSYLAYAGFDILGQQVTGHKVNRLAVLRVAAVSFAINQNLGYMVGGLGLRLNQYTTLGLRPAVIAAVAGTSALTNWLSHFALFGALLVFGTQALPHLWGVAAGVWQIAGGAALALVVAYVWACVAFKRRQWRWRSLELDLPNGRMALLQLALGALHWGFTAAIVWVALPAGANFTAVATALLLAAVAGALAHVPAGVGVLEAVFVALLSDQWPVQQIIAAVMVYRAVYQWLPGALAALVLLVVQRRGRAAGRLAAAPKA